MQAILSYPDDFAPKPTTQTHLKVGVPRTEERPADKKQFRVLAAQANPKVAHTEQNIIQIFIVFGSIQPS